MCKMFVKRHTRTRWHGRHFVATFLFIVCAFTGAAQTIWIFFVEVWNGNHGKMTAVSMRLSVGIVAEKTLADFLSL